MPGPADRTGRLTRQLHGRDRFRYGVEVLARGQDDEFERVVFGARRVDTSSLDPEMAAAFEELRSLMREFDATTRKLFGSLLAIDVLRVLTIRTFAPVPLADRFEPVETAARSPSAGGGAFDIARRRGIASEHRDPAVSP